MIPGSKEGRADRNGPVDGHGNGHAQENRFLLS
jgi:hypothetical protein